MADQRRVMPTMKQVREHWAAWVVAQTGDQDGSPLRDQYGRTVGLCYACGMYWPDCERAHIVARCNGGADTVDNLHALCRPCHKASEAHEGEDYWTWLASWTLTKAVLVRMFHLDASRAAAAVADWLRDVPATEVGCG